MADLFSRPGWRRLFRFGTRDRDRLEAIDDELRFHLESRIQALTDAGMSDDEARQRTLQRFGDIARVRQACDTIDQERARTEHRRAAVRDIAQDLRVALRVLRRQAPVAAIIVLCLALGIGAATTVFSVGDALLLRPPPFPNGSRLMIVGPIRPNTGRPGVASFEYFTDWHARQQSFAAFGAIARETYAVVTDHARRISGASVTSGVFDALGVRPLRGRLIEAEDDVPGAPSVAVVSAAFAVQTFGSVDRAVGATLRLTHRSLEIVGVLDAASQYPDGLAVWTSMPRRPIESQRHTQSLELLAALRPGVSVESARNDLATVHAGLAQENPDVDAKSPPTLMPMRDRYLGNARPAFAALAAASGLLLLIACANVASLQLARSTTRMREVAVRAALGAHRGRLVRLLLTESVLLSMVGGAAGAWLAFRSTDLVVRSIPVQMAPWMAPSIDWRVMGFSLAVAMLSGIVFGLAPALRLAGVAPSRLMHGGGRSGRDPHRVALQRTFVTLQIAMSLVLLAGAAMATRSFNHLTTLDPGFESKDIALFRVSMRDQRYATAEARAALANEVVAGLRSIPGVAEAAAASHVPIADCCSRFGLHVEGEARTRENEHLVTGNVVTPDFFRTMRIGLLRGRTFSQEDRLGAPIVVVVNEHFERELFGGSNAVGRVVHLGSRDATIIGVVRDVKQVSLTDAPEPQFYQSQDQAAWDDLTFAVRLGAGLSASSFMTQARRIVGTIDASMAVYGARTLSDALERAVLSQRMFRSLLRVFALVALILAAAGIHGVTSCYVADRLPEMGVRLALGARPAALVGLIARQGALLVGLGLTVGIAGAVLTVRVLATVLYDVSSNDPWTYAVAASAMGLAALLACVGPAVRATRADPMETLRQS